MKMRFGGLIFMLLFVNIIQIQAQFVKITGSVVDRNTGETLIAATVKATLSSGSEQTFGITNDKGIFNIDIPSPGSYKLEFSYVGYKKLTKMVKLHPGMNPLGKIRMMEEAIELKGANVVGKNMRVKQSADTTVFNADGYKVMAGASGEDLLSKMPGMKISDGKIEAQGEEVKKVLVDGKPFFENDPSLALKSLPAEVIQSIAVFDKMSDQAEFTGFDDGNSVKALDVRTRSYKRNGLFGKIYGQYGTDNRYNVGWNVNMFNGDRRFTTMGLFNNVNQQNFSIDDILGAISSGKKGPGGPGGMGGPRGMGGSRMHESVGSQSGITSAKALGFNYSDQWGDKVEVQASYFFNHTRTELSDSINRNYFDTINGIRNYDALSSSLMKNYEHRGNMRLTYKPTENDEILFLPNLNFQKNNSYSNDNNYTLLNGDTINQSNTESNSKKTGYNLSANLLWRHKFEKEGRTISANFRGGLSENDSKSYDLITLNKSLTDQTVSNNTSGKTLGGSIMYTEPIAKNQQFSASYNANYSNTKIDKLTEENENGETTVNSELSNNYKTDYLTQAVGLGYRLNNKKIRLMFNINLQNASLDGEQMYPWTNEVYKTSKSYNSILPMMMFDFTPINNHSLRLMYRANSSSPSVKQLQNTIDNSNPLQLYQGNPNLNQVVDHSLSLRYIASNIDKATNWMANIRVIKKFDYIGSNVTIFNENTNLENGIHATKGSQLTIPVNLDGYLNLASNLTYGFPIDFLLSNLNISADVNYSITPGIQNDINLKTKSLSLIPGAVLTSNISDKLDFSLSYNADFQQVHNNLNSNSNYDYLTHTANAKMSWVFWKGFVVENILNWKRYTGSSMDESEEFWLWNASIGKKFLKNDRAELKLSAYDILKQNRAFSRSVADAYIQTSYSNVLSRYFMVTFTYNLQMFKKSNSKNTQKKG